MSGQGQSRQEKIDAIFRAKAEWHSRQARKPIKEKVRMLLELQRQDLPLIRRHRQLEPWERPWSISP